MITKGLVSVVLKRIGPGKVRDQLDFEKELTAEI